METTKLTITIPIELGRRAKARAALEGTTLADYIKERLEEFAAGLDEHITLTSLNHLLTAQEVASDKATLEELKSIGLEIDKSWPQNVSAVDAIREQRREL